jgi:hypothetical protein
MGKVSRAVAAAPRALRGRFALVLLTSAVLVVGGCTSPGTSRAITSAPSRTSGPPATSAAPTSTSTSTSTSLPGTPTSTAPTKTTAPLIALPTSWVDDPTMVFTNTEDGILVSGTGDIYRTLDGGSSWVVGSGATRAIALDFASTFDGWAVTSTPTSYLGGPLLRTRDGGMDWEPLPAPLEGPLTTVDFLDSDTGYGITEKGDLLASTDGGTSWTSVRAPAPISDLCFTGAGAGWLSGAGNVYRFDDGSITTSLPAQIIPTGAFGEVPTPTLGCDGETVLAVYVFQVAVSQSPLLLEESTDGGDSWHIVGNTMPEDAFDSEVNAFGLTSPTDAWFLGSCAPCGNGEVSLSWTDDSGAQFGHQVVARSSSFGVNVSTAAFSDPSNGWVLVQEILGPASSPNLPPPSENVLFRTDDGGSSWQLVTVFAPAPPDRGIATPAVQP